ncbi:MAG: aldo/keto reductase, partial [Planctomycetota bacterium]|nr:aldo/keto reductase [Planctomycetota bacterium]
MTSRVLGKTGLSISPIGFGAFKIGRNEKIKYPLPYDLPDDLAVSRLLNGVLDLGITHIDTAPAYGVSEERIGRTLASRRQEFVLSTKVGEIFENGASHYDFSQTAVRESVARSLRLLRTEILDIVCIHAPADDLRVLRETDVVETLKELQRAGTIRAIGFSGKTVPAALEALDWADLLMIEYHVNDRSHAGVIATACERGVGVLVKKGLASGHLPADVAIPFVLNTVGVTGLVVGGLS